LGLWGTDVHYTRTLGWAESVGYYWWGAGLIATYDDAVDSGSSSPFVPWGQKYHFDRPWGGSDST
jgi:hypothetical protein